MIIMMVPMMTIDDYDDVHDDIDEGDSERCCYGRL